MYEGGDDGLIDMFADDTEEEISEDIPDDENPIRPGDIVIQANINP